MERIPFLGAILRRLDLAALAERTGPLQPATARRIVARLNAERETGEARQPLPGELLALSLLHEAAHLAIVEAARRRPAAALAEAVPAVREALGTREADTLLREFADAFPGVEKPADLRLEDLLLVHLANANPAAAPLVELVDESVLPAETLAAAIQALERHQASLPIDDADGSGGALSLLDLLREPARHSPDSLTGQLRYVREHWGWLLGDALTQITDRLDVAIGVLTEEEHGLHMRFGAGAGGGGAGGGGGEAPSFVGAEVESERFSTDLDWMPRLVLLAKSTYVWLDQLSKQHGRPIRTLDAIPDEELAAIAARGITGLWLIGLWQRSRASEKIKRWRGNADAVASAYSLDDYRIADDLGGEDALADLRTRAWTHGIRMASDMVPNHMGLDSRWVIDHPERFISVAEPPFPSYRFEGRNLADDPRIEIRIEDHYWDDSDAAVVFERRDTATGERRYLYHGNDGTSFPWNDTAQLDFAKAEVREVVIQTILDVARRFPVIRFDAAMVLAKKHVERLWYPEPGAGGAIPSRAEHAIPKAAFDALMPDEFWREVVDRVAAEAPDTLLLAEAFWLLEGYFVRTLGMHRVYNSAFMHMIRDEDNAGYRKVIRETVEFDPAILGRYVNFLTNPDEETAIEQFGTADKYFGAATLLATLPGLPMVGHGQIEGFTEKYGMEFQRARLDETPNVGLIAHFDAQIVPLLRERQRFAGSADFRLYDVVADGGHLVEDVFAYSNGRGPNRSLVVYHNRHASTAGWIRESVPFAVKHDDGSKSTTRDVLADALELHGPDDGWLRYRDRRSGRESLRSVGEIRSRGLYVALGAYECLVLDDLREVAATADAPWAELAARLGAGGGVASLDDALAALLRERAPAARPLPAPLDADALRTWFDERVAGHLFSGSALVWRDGEPVFRYAGGLASRSHGVMVDAATRFAVASITKLVTATAALRLVERGLLDLHRPLIEILPAEHRPVALTPEHTLHHLLSHTSGLANYHDDADTTWNSFTSCWDRIPTYHVRRPADMLPLFRDLPAFAPPGTVYRYGDANFILAGLAIEAATGKPYAEVMAEEILGPAGMVDSGFFELDEDPARLATGYLTSNEPPERWRTNIYGVTRAGMPDGGMITTPIDLARLIDALLDGRLVGPNLALAMRSPQGPPTDAVEQYGYGCELVVQAGRVTIIGHGGSDPGVSAMVTHHLDAATTIVALCNQDRGSWAATKQIGTALGLDDPR
ncbi:MAG TPA: serine hydrolase [Patescibacteria group bacterium]|nr:serine hydrolase [Patescibacteria group bacterium]